MYKWYVVQVFTAQEKKVKKALEDFKESSGMTDFIQEIILPIENVMEVKKGEHKVVEKYIWPGYLLVKMHLTDESWLYVKSTAGIVEFLGGGVPVALSEDEVRSILTDIEEKKSGVVQKHQFEVGSRVKINDGVFVNFIGTVSEVFHDKGRLSVMVSIFGRETRVDDLEFWQVEEVAPGQESE
ncbi:transcription termination/antitermination protein NusG [Chlamydia pneumoniae]|uniref:Transcription termination/antitermination protein NusG n=3 Tax=Chlamydia pneumoniae TaxID=83558 RepID=NUSG_CHLPN|nr:transcription termination/antitermination protein NusG [Chlamydia pneumoniae]Q9Z9A5.2 RecName: Full=Transcription termination/antitermination protein NusG [Chlamydia pneumoniae]AAF38507.1 transcription antitermination protein NusG [Chlamydia pneumoniae AR39]CRI35433.1 Transcription termination/antitermination protein NusG [Chlamydia pneumoniae]CRI41080.1 Transcription termination/antitermination protein NusG [Chlamydia pneumoniae]CRI72715.1 Transcription termination/antitermination protein 